MAEGDIGEYLVGQLSDSYTLTHKFWVERNRSFLIVLALTAILFLFTYRDAGAGELAFVSLFKYLDLDPNRIGHNRAERLTRVLTIALLVAILVSIIRVVHRSRDLARLYWYLAQLEDEIRSHFGLDAASVAFTREGKTYKRFQTPYLVPTWYIFRVLLILLSFAALVGVISQTDKFYWQDDAGAFSWQSTLFGIANFLALLAIGWYCFVFICVVDRSSPIPASTKA
jgi:hypothetical protein